MAHWCARSRKSRRAPGDGDRRVGDLIRRLTHEGCGGKPKLVELITGIPGRARGSGASCCTAGDEAGLIH